MNLHGRKRLPGIVCLLALALLPGCDDDPPVSPAPTATTGTAFDPATAGTIRGRVTWTGDVPVVPPFKGWTDVGPDQPGPRRQVQPNPNTPAVGLAGGVGNAVVFLRGVDVRRSRPWDLRTVRVVQRDYGLHVRQGDIEARDGFVHRGDAVEMVAAEPVFHALHASGAAYFTLAFPDPNVSRRRTLDRTGVVELSSAAGYYWARAYLFVDDHPYYTHTGADGRFELPQVPPGEYEVVCWLPNWHEADHERDPETSLITRLHFRPPVERVQPVRVGSGATAEVTFTLSIKDFGPGS
jgi:hypothetical protein